MWFRRFPDGAMIRRNGSSSIQEHQCFESWNPEQEKWKRSHTLPYWYFEHRTFIPNHSLSKSAQYSRSSLKLVWRVRSNTMWERRYFRQVCIQRIWRGSKDGESTRTELFGTDSKEWVACIRKRNVRKSSEQWITVQDQSIYENLRKRIVQAQGIGSVCVTRPFLTWKMILEISPQHAESTHILEQTQNADRMRQFQEEP